MLRFTCWHAAADFRFYLVSADHAPEPDVAMDDELARAGVAVRPGLVAVAVAVADAVIPVDVEVSRRGFDGLRAGAWDRIVEGEIDTPSGRLEFRGGAQPEGFGTLAMAPGIYRWRVYAGGQGRIDLDGRPADRFLVQLWPASPAPP